MKRLSGFSLIFAGFLFIFTFQGCGGRYSTMPIPDYLEIIFLHPNPIKANDTITFGIVWYDESFDVVSADDILITLTKNSKTDTLDILNLYNKYGEKVSDEYVQAIIDKSTFTVQCDLTGYQTGTYFVNVKIGDNTNSTKNQVLIF